MKTLINLIVALILSVNVIAQNLLEDKSFEVSYAAVVDLNTNSKTEITNLKSFKTAKKDTEWGTVFSTFEFYLDEEEYYFISSYSKDTLEDGNLVQKYNQLYLTNKAEILVYYSQDVALENGSEYNIGIIIPDIDNEKIYVFQILDEGFAIENSIKANKNLIIPNPEEAAHWEKFEQIIAEIANSDDITEFKGEEDPKSMFPDIYKLKLKKNSSDEDMLALSYSISKNIYSKKLIQNIQINIFTLEEWLSPKRSELLLASDIANIEAIFDKYLLDDYIKVYKPAASDEFDYNVLGEKERENIKDDIYYVNKKEKNISLSKLQMDYVKIELKENMFSGKTTLSAHFNQME